MNLITLGLVFILGIERCGAVLVRQSNTTLALPLELYQYRLTEAFGGLTFDEPVALVSPPGETNRLFIVERQGRIQVITDFANPSQTLFLDISSQVDSSGEGGLSGMAFHPGYKSNQYFYVFYTQTMTTSQGTGFHNCLERFEACRTNSNQALSTSGVRLITQFDESDAHNGGDLHFGPDGYLYVSLGDEGGGGDTFENSQRIDKDFFSGILRIDVDKLPGSVAPNLHPASSTHYTIPADNPFVGATHFNGLAVDPAQVRTEFWAVGLRNPWRFSFDSLTGRLYCGDVGEAAREEVDVIVRGGNYGWNYREGVNAYQGTPPAGVTLIEPILDYGHADGRCVIGGVVYRGSMIPELFGAYVFGDLDSGNIWAARYDGTNSTDVRQLTSFTGVCAFGRDPVNGDILLVQAFGTVPVYRLVYDQNPDVPLPLTLAETGAFEDVVTLTPQPGIVPYDLNVPFWSDHAQKTRWFSVPGTNTFVGFNTNGNWSFPTGSVWIKHFELELTNGVRESARRLETRFLVRNESGVYGVTYRWDDSQQNAFLVSEGGLNDTFVIDDEGTIRTQVWRYPARSECLSCHTRAGGLALGFNTAQLNRPFNHSGTIENQLQALSRAGYFSSSLPEPTALPALVHPTNTVFSREERVRSYLAANCVQCHQPGGAGRGYWDARFSTPLNQAGLIEGRLIKDFGDGLNKVISPGSPAHSMLLQRIANLGPAHMPPLATSELDQEAIALLSDWITNDLIPSNTPPVAGPDTIRRYPLSGAKVRVAMLLANDVDADNDEILFVSVDSASANGGTVFQQGEWVHYTAPAGWTNDDVFRYQIADSHGHSATGTGTVTVRSDPVPSPVLSVSDLGGGSYQIRFEGSPDVAYRVEYNASLDNSSWQNLGSPTANETGQFGLVDTPPQRFRQRFYRVVYP